jgi:hypothetical protein
MSEPIRFSLRAFAVQGAYFQWFGNNQWGIAMAPSGGIGRRSFLLASMNNESLCLRL